MEETNGRSDTMVRWLMGIVAVLFTFGIGFYVSGLSGKLDETEKRITKLESTFSGIEQIIKQVKETADSVRLEQQRIGTILGNIQYMSSQLDEFTKYIRSQQVDRSIELGNLKNKIDNFETKIQLLERQQATQSERILSINQRLDKAPPKESSQQW